MRRILALVSILMLVLAATAVRAADPYEINVITSLTGPAGFAGQAEQDALRALEAKVNKSGGIEGRPIKFVVHDDGTVPQTTVQLTNELIAQKVPVIIGAALVALCSAMAPLVKDGPVVYCLSNGVHPAAGSFMFSSLMSSQDFITAAIRYERSKGARRVALIAGTDASGQDGEHGFDTTMGLPENKEMTIVAREHFALTDITVAAQLARIKAANPDLIFSWTSGTPAATVLRGISEVGLDNVPVIVSSANATYAQMKQYSSFLPKTLLFGVPPLLAADQITQRATKRAIQDFVDAMAAQGMKPDLLALTAWDPAVKVVDAIKKIGIANLTAERLRASIANLSGVSGAGGVYDFRSIPQRGLDDKQTYVARWDAAKGTWVGVSKAGGFAL